MARALKSALARAPVRLLAAALLTTAAGLAGAQNFPSKTVRFVIGFSPGGPSDILTRLVGTNLSAAMGQP